MPAGAIAEYKTDGKVPLLMVRDLRVSFPVRKGIWFNRDFGNIRAVDGVSFVVQRGETLGLVGESGCGKTTTGRAIVRLLRPSSGSILLNGLELVGLEGYALREIRRQLQMIFQDPYESLDPRMTLEQLVSEPLKIRGEGDSAQRRARVTELLQFVALSPDTMQRYPHEFSAGQRQRIGIARALALNPTLIIADEPVSSLDVSIQAQVINLLRRLQTNFGLTYIFIAHDLAVVRHISSTIAVMYLGRVVEVSPALELYRTPLHPYTVALLSAIPFPDPKIEARRRRIILVGDVPNPAAPPSGCRFHTRCWLSEKLGRPDRCSEVDPPLRSLGAGHTVACHFAEMVDRMPEQRQATGDVFDVTEQAASP